MPQALHRNFDFYINTMCEVHLRHIRCVEESDENQQKRKDHTEDKLPLLQLHPILQLSRYQT